MLQHYRTFACSGIYRVNLHSATRVINCSRGDRFQICNRRGSLCFLNSVSKQTVATSCNPQKDDIRKNWDTDEDDLSARYIREYSKEVFESPKIGEMNNSVNNNLKTKLDVNPIDVLSAFDPDNPPKDLQDLQIWLECQAQQESVLKFQKEVDGARERRDYSSLGKVQKEVLKWYQPLRDAIDAEQKRFLTAKDKTKDMNKFGPYLCTLPAEKIALLLANHAISHCLAHAEKSHHGSTLTSLALEIGEAFETEVMVQKAIAKKLKEKSFYNLSKFENEEAMEELEDFLETSDDGSSAVLPDEVSAFNVSNWRYSTSHRQHFLEQIYRDSDFRGRLKMKRAYRRAQEILDKEESWPHNEQLKVGAALVQILVDEAKVKLNDGKVENAFKYHKVWLNKKLVGWISIHHSFYTSVMEDFVNQKLAFSTRHKPMVVPPDPWVSPTQGGYKWLKVNVMRFHGSNIQKVSF
jgi:DNA-directed RNA polymerase